MGMAIGVIVTGLALVALAGLGAKASASTGSSSSSSSSSSSTDTTTTTATTATATPVSSGSQQGAVTMGDLRSIGSKFGWSGSQLTAWWNVIAAESGGNPNSRNPSSGAYGIGQFLGSTLTEYAKYGASSSNPIDQLNAMAQYIHDRYGTPQAAWAHEQADNWY